MTRIARVSMVLALGISIGCGGDEPTTPTPTTTQDIRFVLELTAPSGANGALLFEVAGGAVTDLRPLSSSGGQIFFRDTGGSTVRVAFRPAEGAQASDYSATVLEVAGLDNGLQSTSGYSLAVVRQGG
jgi:hypothetical protein